MEMVAFPFPLVRQRHLCRHDLLSGEKRRSGKRLFCGLLFKRNAGAGETKPPRIAKTTRFSFQMLGNGTGQIRSQPHTRQFLAFLFSIFANARSPDWNQSPSLRHENPFAGLGILNQVIIQIDSKRTIFLNLPAGTPTNLSNG